MPNLRISSTGVIVPIICGALREDELEDMKNQLLEISQDGQIRDDEVDAVRKISEYLDGIAEVISEFKIMSDKALKGK